MTERQLFKKRQLRLFRGFLTIAALVGIAVVTFPVPHVSAVGVAGTPRDYLSRQQADISSAIQHEVFFTTATAVSGGVGANKVILVFPDGDDGKWCRTAGTDLVATGIANPTGGGTTEGATVLPGSLSGTACTQGSGSSSYDTITVNGVNNLSATTKYGVRIAQAGSPVGLLGTAAAAANSIQITFKTNNGSADVDSATFAVSLVTSDQVAVSGTVNPTLTVSLDTNTAALGTLAAATVSQAGIVSTVTTNAGNGYISMVKYNNTLTSTVGGYTIPDTSGGTIVAGTSEFGASSSQTGNTIAVWNPTACSSTGSTSNATALTAALQDFAVKATAASAEATTLCLLASVVGTQQSGTYQSTLTVVTTARF